MPRIWPLNSGDWSRWAQHELADARVRVEQMAVDLRTRDRPGREGKRHRRIIAALHEERAARDLRLEIDRVAIESRWRAGLQPPAFKAERFQRFRQRSRGRLSRAPRRMLFRTDMNQTIQKRAGRHHQCGAAEGVAFLEFDAGDSSSGRQHAARFADQPVDVRLCVERGLHPPPVYRLVRLCPRRPHRRSAASIEQLELNAGGVDRPAHEPAQRVDLANEMAFGRPSDRGVARHVRHGVGRQRAEANLRTDARRGVRRLTARVPGPDHDHVEGIFHIHM